MRVALACPYAWDSPGGVQVHVRQLAERLRESGHDVLVVTPSSTRPTDPDVRVVGVPVPVAFNGSVARVCPDPRSRRRIVGALTEFRPDVVHAHEPFAPSTGMFATLAARVPVVATFHAYSDRYLVRRTFSPLLRRIWERVRVRLAVSRAAAGYASRGFSGPVRIVPNGVDVEQFRKSDPAPLPPGRRLLFVNRLDRRKGFAVAVQAFRLLSMSFPDALLVVAGDGPQRRALDALPAEYRRRVLMLGSVPHDSLPPYHAAADVFLAPATGGESFGIVLVEAMAAGVPVVASDIAGYREVVRSGIDGLLVRPNHPVELAAAIRRVLDETDLATRLAAAGRSRADAYAWDVVTAQVEDAYRAALGGATR